MATFSLNPLYGVSSDELAAERPSASPRLDRSFSWNLNHPGTLLPSLSLAVSLGHGQSLQDVQPRCTGFGQPLTTSLVPADFGMLRLDDPPLPPPRSSALVGSRFLWVS